MKRSASELGLTLSEVRSCSLMHGFMYLGRVLLRLSRNRNSWDKPNNCSFSGYSHSRVAVHSDTVLTGSDMSVMSYSDHSSHSYSGIGAKECPYSLPSKNRRFVVVVNKCYLALQVSNCCHLLHVGFPYGYFTNFPTPPHQVHILHRRNHVIPK